MAAESLQQDDLSNYQYEPFIHFAMILKEKNIYEVELSRILDLHKKDLLKWNFLSCRCMSIVSAIFCRLI